MAKTDKENQELEKVAAEEIKTNEIDENNLITQIPIADNKVSFSVRTDGRPNPFAPYIERSLVGGGVFDIIDPPSYIPSEEVDSDLMHTTVSGILYNDEKSSAIINVDGTDQLVNKGDKIAFVGSDELAKTMLFKILMGEEKFDSGEVIWGKTVTKSYFPQDNSSYFTKDINIMEWIGQYYNIDDETVLRGFLGRMLFSGEEALKQVNVLSGGEKVRCVLSKVMLSGANFLIFDEPTNHLDMESITALNEGMNRFKGNIRG